MTIESECRTYTVGGWPCYSAPSRDGFVGISKIKSSMSCMDSSELNFADRVGSGQVGDG